MSDEPRPGGGRTRTPVASKSRSSAAADARPSSTLKRLAAVERQVIAGTRGWWPHAAAVLVAVLVVLQPMLLTPRSYGIDWPNHLWLIWEQGLAIRDGHAPTIFLNADPVGVFYPFYGMYGGTLYAIGGTLSSLLGTRPVVAYVAMRGLAVVMAYGGLLWISLLSGLRGVRAHAAPVVYVSSAYFITDIYSRGVLPELTATSGLIVVIAATIHLVYASRIRLLPAAALVGSAVLLTGSHNITLVWSTVIVAALIVAVLVALPHHGRELPRRRMLQIAGLGVLAIGVNAWFLAPDLAHASSTLIANGTGLDPRLQDVFGRASVLFNPGRTAPAVDLQNFAQYLQLPVFVLLWLVIALPAAWRYQRTPGWRRLTLCVVAIFTVLLVLMLAQWPWDVLVPEILGYIQFSFRLQTYTLLCVALLLIAALRVTDKIPYSRWLHGGLAVAVAYGVWLAIWQIWTAPVSYPNTDQVFERGRYQAPTSWHDPGAYRDGSAKSVAVPAKRHVEFDPAAVRDDQLKVTVRVPRGLAPFSTSIATGTYFVDVKGIEPVGRTPGDFGTNGGQMVAARDKPGAARIPVEVTARQSGLMAVGRWVSIISIVALMGLAASSVVRAIRRRTAGA